MCMENNRVLFISCLRRPLYIRAISELVSALKYGKRIRRIFKYFSRECLEYDRTDPSWLALTCATEVQV